MIKLNKSDQKHFIVTHRTNWCWVLMAVIKVMSCWTDWWFNSTGPWMSTWTPGAALLPWCHGATYKCTAKHYLNSGGRSSSLSIPQLLPTSELGLRIARRVIQAKCRRNRTTLLETDFSDLRKKNRRGQASKRVPTSKILNEVGNTQ